MAIKTFIESEHFTEQIDHLKNELHLLRMKIDEDYVRDKNFINKEIANAITHGLGAVIFMVAIPVLLAYSAMYAKAQFTWSVAIFGFGILMVYMSSTLYHGIQHEKAKKTLRIIDHISIFILIGGSYTPIILACLPPEKAITFLTILWVLIVAGAIGKLFFTGRYRLFSTLFYLLICWMALGVIHILFETMPGYSFGALMIGAAFYTIGVVFYLWKSLNYNHAIWHVFVLGGSISHYFVMLEIANSNLM